MKKMFCALLFVVFSVPLLAQQNQFTGTITGTGCVTVPVANRGTVTFQLTGGTWTGTIQPEGQIGANAAFNIQVIPVATTTPQATITVNGTYYTSVAGFDSFLLCGNTVTNTATVTGNSTSVVAKAVGIGGGGGGGGGSGTVSANNGSAGAVANYAAAGGSTTVGPDANLTDASNTLTYSGTSGLSLAAGIALTGASGAATTISTSTANASLLLSPNGTGSTTFTNGLNATPSITFAGGGAASGFWSRGNHVLSFSVSGVDIAEFNTVTLNLASNVSLAFASGSLASTGGDSGLTRQGAALLAIGNGTVGDETGLLRNALPCRITAAVTLSTSSTTICSWSLPAIAKIWSWDCMGTYAITSGTTPAFGLGMNASQAPASETGNGRISSVTAGTTLVETNNQATATTAGNTSIITGATVTTVTHSAWSSWGTVQASATAGTFAVTGILTGTTPAGTVEVGSECYLR